MSFTPDIVPTIFSFKRNHRGSFVIEDYCTGYKTICKPVTLLKQTKKQIARLFLGKKEISDSEDKECEPKQFKTPYDSTIMKRRSLEITNSS